MTIFRFSASTMAFVLLLQGCSEKIGDEDLICNQSPGLITSAGATGDEQVKVAETCIHKWAYRFGRAPGSNTEIARAVVGACREAIDMVLELKVAEGNKAKQPFTDEVWQLFVKRFDENALFRVTQGRAGNCGIRGIEQK